MALRDVKTSNEHAEILQDGNGCYVLRDKKSKNGIRYNGLRVETLPLTIGIEFVLGDSVLRVEADPADENTQVPAAAPTAPSAQEIKLEPQHWSEVLETFGSEIVDKIQNRTTLVEALNPMIRLSFSRGIQAEQQWTLGYGPRKVGSQSLDLPIWEPGAPDTCFEIWPSPKGVAFRTQYPQKVQLNGEAHSQQLLKSGDIIQIGDSYIEVELLK